METLSPDEQFMKRALDLAEKGLGAVEPNPAVGAVIVKDGKVIGEGYHEKFGGAHAEINALADCRNNSFDPAGGVMYVTLEPCCHAGKTGPCTDAIIDAKIGKVVAAIVDPCVHASGKGFDKLRKAGVEVQTGVCAEQGTVINAPFIKFAKTSRPWVILKWAQSIDAKVAYSDTIRQRQWISSEQSRKDVHRLRRQVGAILVGINTVIADDPQLTARPSKGNKATRIVLDGNLRIPLDCKLLATAKKVPVLILTNQQALRENPQIAEKITQNGAQVLACPEEEGRSNLHFLTCELAKRGVAQLLIEGGPTVIASFLKEELVDQIVVYIAPKILGGSGSAAITEPMAELTEAVGLHHVEIERFGDDVRLTGLSKKAFDEISICP